VTAHRHNSVRHTRCQGGRYRQQGMTRRGRFSRSGDKSNGLSAKEWLAAAKLASLAMAEAVWFDLGAHR
jgi:hypothetical protein